MAVVKDDILDLSFQKIPMLKPLLALIVGILCANYVFFPISITLFILLILIFCLLLFTFFIKRNKYAIIAIYLMFAFLGMGIVHKLNPKFMDDYFSVSNGTQFIGIIDSEPIIKEKSIRFFVNIESSFVEDHWQCSQGKIMLIVLIDSLNTTAYKYGDKIAFKNAISEISEAYNPYEFNYKRYLALNNVFYQSFIYDDEILKIGENYGNAIISFAYSVRLKLVQKFEQYMPDERSFNVASALIFGYRSSIDQETISSFVNTGTIHVLSVSGLHVSLVFFILNILLKYLDKLKYGKRIRFILLLFSIWFYVVLTGMSPPILRAGIMITFFIISLWSNTRPNALNTLFASAFFILLLSPLSFYDIGFQLSYVAIIGILILMPIYQHLYSPNNKYSKYLTDYIYVSLAAQLFTTPLVLFYFGQFPNYFLLANLFIAIPSSLAMYFGIGLAIIPFSVLDFYIGYALNWIIMFLMQGLAFIENLPFATIKGIEFSFWQMIMFYLIICFFTIGLNYRRKAEIGYSLLMLIFFSAMWIYYKIQNYHFSAIKFYNVGHEIAIGNINKNRIILFSSLDSIEHPTLKFKTHTDLIRYANLEDVIFEKIESSYFVNKILKIDNQKILLLETKLKDTIGHLDFIVWRKNNKNDFNEIAALYPEAKFIFDGSNTDENIKQYKESFPNHAQMYFLKHNFAYVWRE